MKPFGINSFGINFQKRADKSSDKVKNAPQKEDKSSTKKKVLIGLTALGAIGAAAVAIAHHKKTTEVAQGAKEIINSAKNNISSSPKKEEVAEVVADAVVNTGKKAAKEVSMASEQVLDTISTAAAKSNEAAPKISETVKNIATEAQNITSTVQASNTASITTQAAASAVKETIEQAPVLPVRVLDTPILPPPEKAAQATEQAAETAREIISDAQKTVQGPVITAEAKPVIPFISLHEMDETKIEDATIRQVIINGKKIKAESSAIAAKAKEIGDALDDLNDILFSNIEKLISGSGK